MLTMDPLAVIDAGVMPYGDTLALQKEILAQKKCGRAEDYLILVEHPNIFTIGRSGTEENILVDESLLEERSLRVLHVDRGGDITFHGPGQVVIYPVFDLRNHTKDVRSFIYNLEEVIVRVVGSCGPYAYRNAKYTGIWTSAGKIGFIGIGLSSWITYHGVSLNANIDLKYFSMIRPCGIKDVPVTSLADILGTRIDINDLKELIIKKFCEVFSFEHYSYREDAFLALEAHTGFRSR
ncbi:MAG: lipoyl(octanoyl) transferase LipB [Candidatus Omnitrophota bacterium]